MFVFNVSEVLPTGSPIFSPSQNEGRTLKYANGSTRLEVTKVILFVHQGPDGRQGKQELVGRPVIETSWWLDDSTALFWLLLSCFGELLLAADDFVTTCCWLAWRINGCVRCESLALPASFLFTCDDITKLHCSGRETLEEWASTGKTSTSFPRDFWPVA